MFESQTGKCWEVSGYSAASSSREGGGGFIAPTRSLNGGHTNCAHAPAKFRERQPATAAVSAFMSAVVFIFAILQVSPAYSDELPHNFLIEALKFINSSVETDISRLARRYVPVGTHKTAILDFCEKNGMEILPLPKETRVEGKHKKEMFICIGKTPRRISTKEGVIERFFDTAFTFPHDVRVYFGFSDDRAESVKGVLSANYF